MPKSAEQQLPPVVPGIFTTPAEGGSPSLLGGRCPGCGRDYFPRPPRCPQCLGAVEPKDLGATGRLYTYTIVRVRPPWGLPCPYGLGYIDLDQGGPRVLGLLGPERLEGLAIGQRVRLAVGPLGRDLRGEPCLRPYFEPADPGEEGGAQHG